MVFMARETDPEAGKAYHVMDEDLSSDEIEKRMNAAVSRALNTPRSPITKPTGKGKLSATPQASRVKKATRSKPEYP